MPTRRWSRPSPAKPPAAPISPPRWRSRSRWPRCWSSFLPHVDKVRFANTGTEAAMAAFRLARGHTGRRKIIKFEGHYHGWWDAVLINTNPMPPTASGPPERPDPHLRQLRHPARRRRQDTIVVRWNDVEALERAMALHGREAACVVTEGVMSNMGVIPPKPGYLQADAGAVPRTRRAVLPGRDGDGLPPGRRGVRGTLRPDARPCDLWQGAGRRPADGDDRRAGRCDGGPRMGQGAALRHPQRRAAGAACDQDDAGDDAGRQPGRVTPASSTWAR